MLPGPIAATAVSVLSDLLPNICFLSHRSVDAHICFFPCSMKQGQIDDMLRGLSAHCGESLLLSFHGMCWVSEIVLYMAPLCVIPSHCCAVRAVNMRRKAFDKGVFVLRELDQLHPCATMWLCTVSWLNSIICGRMPAVEMYLFGGFGTLQWLLVCSW